MTVHGMALHGSYNYWLVGLSVVLAMVASYAALQLAGRVASAHHRARFFWLAGGAVSLGLGIWAMHYVGMLAFRLPEEVLYHCPTVLLSLLAAIGASAVALFTVSRDRLDALSALIGSLVMGAGIASMHYIGMAAMRMSAMVEYRLSIVFLSVVVAVVNSLVALVLCFQVRQDQARKEKKAVQRELLNAVVMGSAIPLMHYTGMLAATFRQSSVVPDLAHSIRISSLGITAITGVTLLVLAVAIGTSFMDRLLLSKQSEITGARQSESLFRTMAETVPQIMWTASPDGAQEFFGSRWHEYSGQSLDESRGSGWKAVVHPDDLVEVNAKWEQACRTGESFEIEYRLRRGSDGAYRWFLGRANAIRDEKGEIVKWFGTHTDIEEQKHHQQILELQIKERTEELAETNTRLHEEMIQRDYARREYDDQNAKILRELTDRSQRATLLAKMGELLQSCVAKEEVFAAALGFAPKIFPTRRGALVLLNAARNLVEVAGQWNDCQLPVPIFEPNACWAMRTGHPHLVVAGDTTAPCAHAAGVKNAYLCIPILAQGEALGILHIQATDEVSGFDDAEMSFKTTFAGQVGLSVANIRLREALRTQSIKDPLTGLYNRRYLEEMLEREIRRAIRAGHPLGVLVLDLDHFKKFNDTYGHDAGDTVLRETASYLCRSIRAEDIVCRFGGEEFVIILPTADLAASQARAERIRSKLCELTVIHQGSSLGKITLSIGVAGVPLHGTSPKELFEAADAALYRAKKEGRDRVVVAGPPVSAEAAATAISQSAGA
jgi:diguanylate cyclase (GGDEF)-like protein/PAS domain S-box-containing protein